MSSHSTATHEKKPSGSRRAEVLADRIEEGAANLAAFAEGLSEAEWRTPVNESGKHSRTVGIIVHHVASVYPIEVDLARTIAAGKAVTEVTWEAVAEMNSKHAIDQAAVTKAATIELLRRNIGPAPELEVALDELTRMGFAVVLYANAALQASIAGMQKVLGHLQAHGSLAAVSDQLAGFEERQRIVSKPHFDALEKKYSG